MLFFIASLWACNKELAYEVDDDLQEPGEQWQFKTPSHFPAPVYPINTNPITRAGFALGKKLFYDPILSVNNTISCGSCHLQTSAFTQHGHSVSHGVFDRLGKRNSQPIMNLAWSGSFMWDGGVFNLDLQPIAPITNHEEMDDSVANVLNRLRNSAIYPPLFKAAFGTAEINTTNFLKALSQFMLMCVSSNAKYDSVMRGQANFTASEAEGYAVFRQKCSSCHKEPLFTDHSFRNNGLAISWVNDVGRSAISLHDTDAYKFKVPSLRNLSFTPPYMHDGRFYTLEAVLDHYTKQVQNTPNLDPLLQKNNVMGIALSTEEKQQIVSFLHTLDDKNFILDERFAED